MVTIHWMIFDILIMIPMALVSNFFFSEDGKFRKRLIRKRLNTILKFCDEDDGCVIVFDCKHKRFKMHVDKYKVNDVYYAYHIYVNDQWVGTYHNIDHLMTTSSEFETINGRDKDEVLLLIKKATKEVKKALRMKERNAFLDRVCEKEDKSFFN